ncbi:hypothetical protein WG66_006716 [Moniliophthora roreri]|nr:hypothetical protein WG66_006716 [Moniliophthora roreri]
MYWFWIRLTLSLEKDSRCLKERRALKYLPAPNPHALRTSQPSGTRVKRELPHFIACTRSIQALEAKLEILSFCFELLRRAPWRRHGCWDELKHLRLSGCFDRRRMTSRVDCLRLPFQLHLELSLSRARNQAAMPNIYGRSITSCDRTVNIALLQRRSIETSLTPVPIEPVALLQHVPVRLDHCPSFSTQLV